MNSQPTVVAQPLDTVVIMSSQLTVVAQPVMVHVLLWGYVVGDTLVSGTTQQCTIKTEKTVPYTIQTL